MRREGSYIYEEFLPTGGTDVKVVEFCIYFACQLDVLKACLFFDFSVLFV